MRHRLLTIPRKLLNTTPKTMSTLNIGTLPRLTNDDLATLLRNPTTKSQTAIIDVRDNDYIGGHIRDGQNIPISSLDYKLPELVRTLQDKETVVFHCMLSQQRGPSAALRYARERERMLKHQGTGGAVEGQGADAERNEDGQVVKQKVCVLAGGFEKWQEKYGEDERLTEGYRKDIWLMEDSD